MTPETVLPSVRGGGAYRIGLVCLGNICRSPMAAIVLRRQLARAGLDSLVEVDSTGTGDWHVGTGIDRRAGAVLATAGYDSSEHRAQQITRRWFDEHDLILVMDQGNLREVEDLAGDADTVERVRMFRHFDPRATDQDREVPDPYYGGDDGFASVLTIIERTAEELVERLRRHLRTA